MYIYTYICVCVYLYIEKDNATQWEQLASNPKAWDDLTDEFCQGSWRNMISNPLDPEFDTNAEVTLHA